MTRRSAALTFALAMTAAAHTEPPPPPRIELPVREVDLSDGTRRYAVQLTIGGVAMDAGLDTGSTGLRVLAPRLTAPLHGGAASQYSYSSGLIIEGRVTKIAVQFGLAAGSVPVQLIEKLGCTSIHPECPGKTLGVADYGIQGDGLKNEGFPAILGINMADNSVTNPLMALGVVRWIVELPQPGKDGTGRLILDPTNEEVANFTRLPLIPALLTRNSGVHDAIPGCVVRTDTDAKFCGPVMFDSGAPGLRISLPEFNSPWPAGTPGQLVVGGNGQNVALAFTTGRREQASGMFQERIGANAVPHISAGLMPYFGWSVLYEPNAKSIGLKPR